MINKKVVVLGFLIVCFKIFTSRQIYLSPYSQCPAFFKNGMFTSPICRSYKSLAMIKELLRERGYSIDTIDYAKNLEDLKKQV